MLEKLRNEARITLERRLDPLASGLIRLGVLPNHVTVGGVALNLGTAALVVRGELLGAGLVWLLAGVLDLLDGALARNGGQTTAMGAFLDSTLDRVSEGIVFTAIAYHFAVAGESVNAALTVLALLGSLLVSYTRARAEALGASCKAGILTRAERVVLLGAGLCLDLLASVVWLLVAFTGITVVQRIREAMRELAVKQ